MFKQLGDLGKKIGDKTAGIVDGVKDGAVEMMLKKQLEKLPPEQREMVLSAVKNNPEFFKKIADEIKALEKQGKNQMAASMEVMRKYQGDLQKIMTNKK